MSSSSCTPSTTRGRRRQQLISSSLLFLAAVAVNPMVHAHPNAACAAVSNHPLFAATSDVETFTNPSAAGIGKLSVVIYETSIGGLDATVGQGPDHPVYDNTNKFWEMYTQFMNGTFTIDTNVAPNTARIVAQNQTFLVTYVQNGGVIVTSRKINSNFASVSQGVEIGSNLTPDVATLAAGISGFFYAQVSGTTLSVFKTTNGDAWNQLSTAAATAPVNGPMASAVDSTGNYIVVYHTDSTALACAVSALGTAGLTAGTVPPVTGVSVSIASSAANTFMVIANDAGDIGSSVTQDLASTWQAAQVLDTTANVDDASVVGLIKTSFKWTAVFTGQSQLNVQYRAVAAAVPTTADWANTTLSAFVSGGTGLRYINPRISATGGQGWALVATDNATNDVTFRACYDAPAALNQGSGSVHVAATMASLMAVLFGSLVLLL